MAKSLRQLQQSFALAQHYQDHQLDEDIQAGTFSVEQRLQVYRNNFIISLTEVMSATYPVCDAVVGTECFQPLARQHVLTHPLCCGDVSDYGAGFADTLKQYPSIIDTVPYLPDLAALEWHVDRVSAAGATQAPFPIEALSQWVESHQEAGLARIILIPHGQLFTSSYAVGTLWQMAKQDAVEPFELAQDEVCWVQSRQQGIEVLTLDEPSHGLIMLALARKPLAQASDAMLAVLPELIQKQIFSTYSLMEESHDHLTE
ncbi:DNA-binding domain-containing protein [Thaumasiovibrio sp. DFM-14]|uniref:HvfC/BufC N-terminal domain-containing protein n=1 Tax=Thaumasiovibrio sp. DFM-14 TaxID=3384792 RepID=UPI0039A16AD6